MFLNNQQTNHPAAKDPVVTRLRALAHDTPNLQESAEIYACIVPALRDADLKPEPVTLTRREASARLEVGRPLLLPIRLELDFAAARDLMIRLAQAVEELAPEKKNDRRWLLWPTRPDAESEAKAHARERWAAAREVRWALEEHILDPVELMRAAAAEDRNAATALAQSVQLDPALVWTIAQNACKPALRAAQQQCAELVRGVEWRRGYCWACGANATLGELQGSAQAKHLRCDRCGADWEYPRLECIYCGNVDSKTMGILYPEGERDKHRIEVCDRCHGYIKVINAFDPTPVEMLAVQDLATLHLDYIAQVYGYVRTKEKPKGASAWRY